MRLQLLERVHQNPDVLVAAGVADVDVQRDLIRSPHVRRKTANEYISKVVLVERSEDLEKCTVHHGLKRRTRERRSSRLAAACSALRSRSAGVLRSKSIIIVASIRQSTASLSRQARSTSLLSAVRESSGEGPLRMFRNSTTRPLPAIIPIPPVRRAGLCAPGQ